MEAKQTTGSTSQSETLLLILLPMVLPSRRRSQDPDMSSSGQS